MTLMNAAGLELSFGTHNVFGDVSFLIDERDHVGLVGVNGCGKTSLFKVLTGEYTADSGSFGEQAHPCGLCRAVRHQQQPHGL